jgi:porin
MQGIKEVRVRTARPSFPRIIAAGLVGVGLLGNLGTAAIASPATDQAPAKDQTSTPTGKSVKSKKIAASRKSHPAEPVYKSAAVVAAAPVPACSLESAAALEKKYNIKGWIIPAPRFGNSITGDTDCWRTNLAKYGFGVLAYSNFIQQSNMLDHYTPPSNQQKYAGQKWNGGMSHQIWLLYDLSQYGIPDGQLQIGGVYGANTWINFAPNTLSLGQLSYYQTALNGALEFNVGYLNLINQFQGVQVGGNLANVLGPASGIQQEVGGNYNTTVTPAAVVRWNITDRFYDKAAVSRSLVPSAVGGLGNSILQEHYSSPSGFAVTDRPNIFGIQYPAARELVTNEIGYKNLAAPGDPATWIRVDTYYNFSNYENLQDPGTVQHPGEQVHNMAAQLFVDRQIWQFEPDSAATAYKGIYIGGTAAYASPQANPVYEDFGARLYTYGMFNRPYDQLSLIWEHQSYSPFISNPIDTSATCFSGTECIRHATNTYSVIYNANIIHGLYVGVGVSYIDHPASAWSPDALPYGSTAAPVNPQLNINHAINFLASMHVNL